MNTSENQNIIALGIDRTDAEHAFHLDDAEGKDQTNGPPSIRLHMASNGCTNRDGFRSNDSGATLLHFEETPERIRMPDAVGTVTGDGFFARFMQHAE